MQLHTIVRWALPVCICMSPFVYGAVQDSTRDHVRYAGHIVLKPRPVYHHVPLQATQWDFVTATPYPCTGALKVGGVYTRSTNGSEVAGYFLPRCTQEITIGSGNSTPQDPHDVRAEWLDLGLDANTKATLSLCPREKQYGCILSYNQPLGAFTDIPFLQGWWFEFMAPIIHTERSLEATASDTRVYEALGPQRLDYASIRKACTEKTGIPEIQALFGGTYIHRNGFLLTYYSGMGLPTEDRPKPDMLFPATLGNNTHAMLIAGINAHAPLMTWRDTCAGSLYIHIKNHHALPNHQYRTIPLRDKPWSQYLLVRKEGDPQTRPAGDVTTRRVKVSPHSFVDLSTGIAMTTPCFSWRCGYGLWGHHDEQVELRDEICSTTGVAMHRYGIAGTGTNSASKSTIDRRAPNDATFVTLNDTDLDMRAAGARGVVQHRLDISCTYTPNETSQGAFVTVGGWYAAPNNNTAFHTWGLWANAGMRF